MNLFTFKGRDGREGSRGEAGPQVSKIRLCSLVIIYLAIYALF